MFTGIIEGRGRVKAITRGSGGGASMDVEASFSLENLKVGDSMAVNGACLTAVQVQTNAFKVDLAPETLARTTLGQTRVGDTVNLERALLFSDRVSGHLVTGHVDGIGTVKAIRPEGNATLFTFDVPEDLSLYIVQKGSVAVDGISLTVNACRPQTFEVSVIPHTASITTMGYKKVGEKVNIETDMIGKYVERFTRHFIRGDTKIEKKETSINETLLKSAGFM